MKLNKLPLLLFIVLIIAAFPQETFAHVLKTDSAIGAILHVNPEDDPIAGEPTNFFFAIKDKQNQFDTNICDCQITITQNNQKLIQQPITIDPENKTAALFTYTFPQKDLYQITLTGKPTQQNTFQPFSLTYDIRVAREKEQQTPQNTPLLPILIGAIIGFTLLIVFWKK